MLRVTQQADSQAAKKYYSQADYLSEGQEIVGSWGGEAARRLKLNGVVDREAFEALCDNIDPRTGKQLTARTRSDRTVGYDLTFSVSKSVSLLYALTGDQEIMTAFRAAVEETMREDVEPEMKTRVRKGGRDEDRVTGNMLWAEFPHTTARPIDDVPDPHIHDHVFAFNATWDDREQRIKAGQFRDLKASGPYFQAAFRVRLANKLQDLGFPIERKRDDFEIAGVPASVIKKFSRRTDEIEEAYTKKLAKRLVKLGCGVMRDDGQLEVNGELQSAEQILAVAEQYGIVSAKDKAEMGARTREKKSHGLSWNQLRMEWDSRLTHDERQAIAKVHRREVRPARPARGEGMAIDHAIGHCFVREAVVSERSLLTEALKRGLGAVTIEGVKRELARRPLIRGEHAGRPVVTTEDMRAAEARLVAFARDGRGRLRPLGDANRPITREPFNEGQKAAVRHVLGSRDAVTIIRGAAGTGKTTLEDELRLALAEAGVKVAALAQSTGAVDELRKESGFKDAVTIAHFFKDTRRQASVRDGLILVDEASQVGTRDMLRLFDIARDAGARVVLVGDKRQHRSVSAGEPLRLLEERAGVRAAEVTEIVRQEHGDYRKAAKALAEGRTEDGFAELDKLGWIREIPHAGRYWVLAQGYLSTVMEKDRKGKPKTALVVCPTHAEGDRVTRFIRDALKADGRLGKERTLPAWIPAHLTDPQKADASNYEPGDLLQFHQNAPGRKKGSRLVVAEGAEPPVQYADRFEVYRPAELRLAAGDRVRVTANGWTEDGKHRLKNGMLLTVQRFTPRGDPVVDKGWVIGRDFGHLAHGYAVTSHAAQGKTVSKVFAGISSQSFPATTQRTAYVAWTRGKEQVVVFTDDKKELLKAVKRPDQPLSALDLARARARKPPLRLRLQKHLAHLRRQSTLARTHPPRPADRAMTRSSQREATGHER